MPASGNKSGNKSGNHSLRRLSGERSDGGFQTRIGELSVQAVQSLASRRGQFYGGAPLLDPERHSPLNSRRYSSNFQTSSTQLIDDGGSKQPKLRRRGVVFGEDNNISLFYAGDVAKSPQCVRQKIAENLPDFKELGGLRHEAPDFGSRGQEFTEFLGWHGAQLEGGTCTSY